MTDRHSVFATLRGELERVAAVIASGQVTGLNECVELNKLYGAAAAHEPFAPHEMLVRRLRYAMGDETVDVGAVYPAMADMAPKPKWDEGLLLGFMPGAHHWSAPLLEYPQGDLRLLWVTRTDSSWVPLRDAQAYAALLEPRPLNDGLAQSYKGLGELLDKLEEDHALNEHLLRPLNAGQGWKPPLSEKLTMARKLMACDRPANVPHQYLPVFYELGRFGALLLATMLVCQESTGRLHATLRKGIETNPHLPRIIALLGPRTPLPA